MAKVYGADKAGFESVKAAFFTGALDSALMDRAKAMDPKLAMEDLSYIRSKAHSELGSWSPSRLQKALGDAQNAKLESDFQLLVQEIRSEQLLMTRWVAEVTEAEAAHSAAAVEAASSHDKAKEKAINDHMLQYFPIEVLPDRRGMRACLDGQCRTFCLAPPTKVEEHCMQLGVISLSGLGVQHSLYLKELATVVETVLSERPRLAAFLVVLPNTPSWGRGLKPSSPGWEEAVKQARAEAVMAFTSLGEAVHVQDIFGKYAPEQMYSDSRELFLHFLFLTSNATVAENPVAVYRSSPVWQHRGIPVDLPVLQRSQYRHWTDAVLRANVGNLDGFVELRQHHSGAEFWDTVLTQIHSGPLGSRNFAVHVQHYMMYDPELAKGVMNLRARKSEALPTFGYAGVTFKNFVHEDGGNHLAGNLKMECFSHLSYIVDSIQEDYFLPGYVRKAGSPGVLESRPPPAAPATFKHCQVVGRTLPLKQAVHDEWDKQVVTKDRWSTFVVEHNKQFNQSGVPWKPNSRPAPVALNNMPETQAVTLSNPPGAPQNVEELVKLCPEVLLFLKFVKQPEVQKPPV